MRLTTTVWRKVRINYETEEMQIVRIPYWNLDSWGNIAGKYVDQIEFILLKYNF